jgi:hypothetical protein
MSKNQKTYLLLFAVAIVWGAVGFQFFNYYDSDVPEMDIPIAEKFVPNQPTKSESYTIQPDYRDPFLGKLYKKPKPKPKKRIVKPKPQVVFPSIAYNGIIKSGKDNTFIITINGSQEIFKVKQAFKGVELIRGNDKEVTLKFQGATKKYPILQ